MRRGERESPEVAEIERLADLVMARLGVEAAPAALEEFLTEVARDGSAAAYIEALNSFDSEARWSGEPATRLLTHETYFFRNKSHWEALKASVIPELLKRLDADGSHLRIWSAGCASGEEPLSIAMTLLDMGLGCLVEPGRILATDVSDASLVQASVGNYTANALRCMPDGSIDRYFAAHGGKWTIKPGVAELVRYQRLNLADKVAVDTFIANEGPFHIVFCRNVLIYFQVELCSRLLNQFASALHKEGTLFLGHAEFPQMWSDAFEPMHACGTMVWRHRTKADSRDRKRTDDRPPHTQLHGQPEKNVLVPSGATGRSAGACCSVKACAAQRNPARSGELAATDRVAGDRCAGLGETWPAVIEVIQHARFGRSSQAVAVARRLTEDHQLVPESHYVMGMALEVAGQSDCAVRAYRNAIFLDAEFAHAHWRLGMTLAASRQHATAISAVRSAIRLMPTEHDTRVQHLSDLSREELIRMMEQTLQWLLTQTN